MAYIKKVAVLIFFGIKFILEKQCLEINIKKLKSWCELKIDVKSTRSQRINTDKFTHVREIFEAFIRNCNKSYTPDFSLTVDKQLLSLKNRCLFIVYMPDKPD